MPMLWVPPAVAVEANDVVVYHYYKNDDATNQYDFWFRVSEDEQDEAFDIRDWSGYVSSSSSLVNLRSACLAGVIIPVPEDIESSEWCGLQVRDGALK